MNMLVNEKDSERLIALNKSTGHIQKFVEYNEIITMMEKVVNSDIQDLTTRKKLATELFNLLKKDNTIEACALMQKDVHLVLNQEMDRDMNKIRLKYKPVFQ
jgi:tyrosine-protein phosphatase YwqE